VAPGKILAQARAATNSILILKTGTSLAAEDRYYHTRIVVALERLDHPGLSVNAAPFAPATAFGAQLPHSKNGTSVIPIDNWDSRPDARGIRAGAKPQRIPEGTVAMTGAGQLGSAHVITLVSLAVTLPTSPGRAEASAPR
jgi:hypothetical protein